MSDSFDTYYHDHWASVEPERMARYEAMFAWRENQAALIAPADLQAGQTVVDFGCGPGGLAMELARRVGSEGRVIGLDINPDFLAKALQLAQREGVAQQIETRQLTSERIPLEDASVDRVVCKNVLEYVSDPGLVISEFKRILKPGGKAHVTDSDWGAFMYSPDEATFAEIMAGAAIAFNTPLIGRRLYGLFREAGFAEPRVKIVAGADTSGMLRSVLVNMAGYAKTSGAVSKAQVARFVAGVDQAIEAKTFFALLPQFLVTASAD